MATGKFEVYIDRTGKYRFRLKAFNGKIIAVGESYNSKSACMNGIESIKRNAASAIIEELDRLNPQPEPPIKKPK